MAKTVTIKMTRKDAHELGLLICACGHFENNHFDFDHRQCVHCWGKGCKGYKEVARRGKIVKGKKS